MGMCSSKLASCFQWISSNLDPYEDLPIPEIITTASTSLPSSSSSSSSRLDPYKDLPINKRINTASTSLPSSSSSSLDLFEYMPTQKRIKTASTSLPSSSSSASPSKYDVFLSFRGEDTRNNFVDHLYKELKQKGIHTFLDEKWLEQGKEISPELLKAIEESRFAIIIFSENYASSSWCLDELVKIIDCTKKTGQIAYPIFYNVNPSNVRKQEGSFAKAFDEHEKKNLALKKMEKWREALFQAGSLSGWDTRGRPEAEIIQKIVDKIFYKLNRGLLHVDDNLVGMEIHMKEINTFFDSRPDEVIFVGIYGLGGIGKTTIAKFIYKQIFNQFKGCSYLANIREKYEKEGNLVSLQEQLLYDILKVQGLRIGDDDSGRSVIQHRLNSQKVLVILDDVDDVNQLEKLAGNGKWFGLGSRIIITTRDKHLLNTYEAVQRYEVRGCDLDKSLEIFSWKAFKQNYPPEDYMELSNEVVDYAKGLPLALTVLGSHLYGRNKDEWEGAIEELKIIPNKEITRILEISYKGLSSIQKEVFLDIACFFNGKDKDGVMEKLHSFGFFPKRNIPALIDKSLIIVSAKNELIMHDLVRDMGRHIVHQESPKNPGQRSRLWNIEDIRQVLENNMATKTIEGIQLETSMDGWSFKAKAFMKMNLRFLELVYYPCIHLGLDFPHDKLVHLSLIHDSWKFLWNRRKAIEAIVDIQRKAKAFMEMKNLIFLEIKYDDYKILPLDFLHDKLVHLSLIDSSLILLWNGRKVLPHLKSIDLSNSEDLIEFPDVTGLPKLERLSLLGCKGLVKIDPSVWVHKGLKFLDLGGCSNLRSFLNKSEMESLETFDLYDYSTFLEPLDLYDYTKMKEFPEVHGNMKLSSKLLLSATAIKGLPSSIENFTALKILYLNDCWNLVCLPLSICKLKYLEQLILRNCSALDTLPEDLGELESLVELDASNTAIKEVPASIQFLAKLRKLNFAFCRGLKLPSFYGLLSLTELKLGYCHLTDETFPSNIECLSSLETLCLRGNNFVSLPANITQLSLLTVLDLWGCRNLEKLPESLGDLESLVELNASETAIKEVPDSIQFLDKLRNLSFCYCSGLKLPSFNGLSSLTSLDLSYCSRLKLPSFNGLSSLTKLDLGYCDLTDETFPSNIECLSSLEISRLSGNNFVSLPANISQLSLLTDLHLSNCKRIKSIPELPSIRFFFAFGCTSLTYVPTPIKALECYYR